MSNNWLDSEIDELRSEIRRHENNRRHKEATIKHEKSVMLRLIVCCSVFFCCFGIFLTANLAIQS